MSKKQLKTGDMVLSRIYQENDIDMVEVVTIVFKRGKPVGEEVNHFTLEQFNSAMLEKQNGN